MPKVVSFSGIPLASHDHTIQGPETDLLLERYEELSVEDTSIFSVCGWVVVVLMDQEIFGHHPKVDS
jgi:hypothetical protein